MKARVKATGKIVSVMVANKGFDYNGMSFVNYVDDKGGYYADHQLDFDNPDGSPEDYWTRLEHTYAGMAMQGILSNEDMQKELMRVFGKEEAIEDTIVDYAKDMAQLLVKKMKEERK